MTSDNIILYEPFFAPSEMPESLSPQGVLHFSHFAFVALTSHNLNFLS